jgi:hypothetical protein
MPGQRATLRTTISQPNAVVSHHIPAMIAATTARVMLLVINLAR